MGIVYCAENIVNGYKYIGITVQSLEIRKKSHFNAAYNPNSHEYNRPFKKALRDNSCPFKWYILEETDDINELKRLERFYISKYKTYIGFSDCKGYNATLGGDGVSVIGDKVIRVDYRDYSIKEMFNCISDVEKKYNTKVHIMMCCQCNRESAYGDVWYYNSMYKSLTQDELIEDVDYRVNKIYKIDSNHNIVSKFNSFEELLNVYGFVKFKEIVQNSIKYGFCFAKDYYIHIYDRGLYYTDTFIVQYDKNGVLLNVFLSLHDAENKTGVFRVSIKEVCEYKKITAGGFQWRYIYDDKSVNSVKVGIENSIVEVSQYTIDGNYIKTFNSMSEASRITGIDVSSISKVCRGIKQTTGGFRWCYGSNTNKLKELNIYEYNQKKPVMYVDNQGKQHIFESVNEASRQIGVSSKTISMHCKNKVKNPKWFFIS